MSSIPGFMMLLKIWVIKSNPLLPKKLRRLHEVLYEEGELLISET
jgi:hypothetical protein